MALPTEFDIDGATYYAVAPSGYSYSEAQTAQYSTRKYTSLSAATAALENAAHPVINVIGSWPGDDADGNVLVPAITAASGIDIRCIGDAKSTYRLNRGSSYGILRSQFVGRCAFWDMTIRWSPGSGAASGDSGIYTDGNNTRLDFLRCIGETDAAPSSASVLLSCGGSSTGTTINAISCLLRGYGSTNRMAAGYAGTSGSNLRFHNCTITGLTYGMYQTGSGTATAKNVGNRAGTAWVGTVGQTTCSTSSPTFEADGYHLDADDTTWRGEGTDLSADATYPVTMDIDGEDITEWSIGSDCIADSEPTTYTVEAGAGAATGTGTAASLLAHRAVSAASGAATATGTAAGLLASRVVVAAGGAVTATGGAASLLASRVVAAGAGTATATGTSSALLASRVIAAASGAVTATGTNAEISSTAATTVTVDADGGAATVTGTAAFLLASRIVAAGAGSVTATGTAAGALASRVVSADSGVATATGTAATLLAHRSVTAASGAVTATGSAVSLLADRVLAALAGAATATGTDVAFGKSYLLLAESGEAEASGTAASLLAQLTIVAAGGAVTATGTDADVDVVGVTAVGTVHLSARPVGMASISASSARCAELVVRRATVTLEAHT